MIFKVKWISCLLCMGLLCMTDHVGAQNIYRKNKTFYFSIDSIGSRVPYERGTPNVYIQDDSVLYDLRFNKFSRRLIVTHYRKDDYYSDGYAPPQAVIKYKTSKARLDTTKSADQITGKTFYKVSKQYTTKLLDRIDYFKYKSK